MRLYVSIILLTCNPLCHRVQNASRWPLFSLSTNQPSPSIIILMSKTHLTKEDILRIARLANLSVTDEEEIKKYQEQLSETINYVENLNELDTKDVKPSSHSIDMANVMFADGIPNTRGFIAEQATANAQQHKKGLFVVPRVLSHS